MATGTATPTVYLPRPMDHQIPILTSDARFKVLACGRRWGKTATGLLACLRGHGSRRGRFRGAIDGGTVWWVAPSYRQLDNSQIWRDLKRATEDAWLEKSEISRHIVLPGGGSITVKSADEPDSLRGAGLDGLVVDEAAFITRDSWIKALRPALSDKQGWAILASTPNGQNWFHESYASGLKDGGEWQSWKLPSSDNPLVTAAELESLREEIGPLAFLQEHMAEFMAMEGALFPPEYFEDHIWPDVWPDRFDACVMAIDPSLGETDRSDYSAIVMLGLTGGTLYVDCSIERRVPSKIIDDAIAMWRQYQPAVIGCEKNGFQAVLETLFNHQCERLNLPPLPLAMISNSEKKQVRIQRLDPHLANRKLRFHPGRPGSKLMVGQLKVFPIKGEHDDGPDALEMAVRLLNWATSSGPAQQEYLAA